MPRPVKFGYRISETQLPIILKTEFDAVIKDIPTQYSDSVVRGAIGLGFIGAAYPQADPNDTLTIKNSIAKRISRIPPKIKDDISILLQGFVMSKVKLFEPLSVDVDLSFEHWIENTNYSNSRREELRLVYKSIQESDVALFSKKMNKVKCFIKDEGYPEYKNARGIYARSDYFKVIFGPLCKAMEDVLYKHPAFIKHVPVVDRAKYVYDRLSGRNHYVATDYTGFECHFTPRIMNIIEFQFYRHLFQTSEHFMLLEQCLRVLSGWNECRFRNLSANILARRMSGEMNTSLGNGFSNYMLYLFINHHIGNTNYDCVIEGDDCLGAFDGTVPTKEMYEECGFTVKIEHHTRLEKASFCGLIFDTDSFVSIADPTKHILNVSWCSKKYANSSSKTRTELLRGKGFSLVTQYRGVPILQSLGLAILRLTAGNRYKLDLSWFERKEFSTNVDPLEVNMSSRVLMSEVFGYSVEEQLCIENFYDTLPSLSDYFHPLIYDHCNDDQKHYFLNYVKYVDTYWSVMPRGSIKTK